MDDTIGDVRNAPRFKDRREAAQQLARALDRVRGFRPLFLAIPRGGVVLGDVLADTLDGDLDVALVRKLGAPNAPELAVGAVTESARVVLNEGWEYLASEAYLRAEVEDALDLLRRRRETYTPHRPPSSPSGRLAIVVDDGVATGATMIAALRSLKNSGAERVVAAAAVAPPETVELLRQEADEVVVLRTPHPFHAVSLYFEDFSEVSDEEVVKLLARRSERPAAVARYHGNFGLQPPRPPP
jgi:putative phosphoribosyl transferase